MLARLLWRYLRPYRPLLAGVLVFQLASALAMLYLPSLNADVIDKGVAAGDTGYIWRTGGFMLAVSLGQIVAAIIATYLAARASMQLGRDIRDEVYHQVSGFSEREISQFGAGSLITRNTNDVQQVQMLAMMGSTMLVSAPLLAIGGIVMALRQDVGLSWIIAVAVPALLIIAGLVISRMVPLFRSYQLKLDAVNRIMREQLTGVRVVRAFVRETIEAERFRLANTDIMVVGRKIGSLFVALFPLVMLVLNVTVIGVIWFGGIKVNVQQVQMLAMMGSTMLVSAPLLAIGGIVMALRQDVGLSWIIAVAVPALLIIAGLVISRMVPLFRSYQLKLDAVNRIMREQLTGVRVVRAFVRETIEAERFRLANTDIMVVGRKIGSLFVALFPLVMLVLNVTVIGVIWFGGIKVNEGQVQIGTLLAFMQYVGQILMGVLMASFMTVMLPRAAVSAERISEVLASRSTLTEAAEPVHQLPTPGEVAFADVTFSYPEAEHAVLSGISFTARPGQTVALIGSTGAGKTTLVSLIPRLFDATGGTVRVGGVDVRDADMEALWSQIGLVPQRPFLFAGTVASNLRLGRDDATDADLWKALEIAQASDFVAQMDGGLDARIAQGGTNVSGGQRQRLAIARAIVRRPAVLIFDDSFSALDLATDAHLRQALWRELPEVTKIVVAQRVSTVTDADSILVLEDGHIAGAGTHTELLATNQTYREIAESQLAVGAGA
ncbi:ABC transporter transmembrane domain-containing protein [Cellulomonas sp. 73-145]|nr:ABC transporter transmembrane domain-containing protein [Cellulomonas sp. 73-145]